MFRGMVSDSEQAKRKRRTIDISRAAAGMSKKLGRNFVSSFWADFRFLSVCCEGGGIGRWVLRGCLHKTRKYEESRVSRDHM